MARGHHVRLEQSPFQVYMMITQGLVHSSQDLGSRGDLCELGPLPSALCSPSRGRWVQETKGTIEARSLKPVLESAKIRAWILAGMGYGHHARLSWPCLHPAVVLPSL